MNPDPGIGKGSIGQVVDPSESPRLIGRRDFVTWLGAFFAAQVLLPRPLHAKDVSLAPKPLRIGFLTDCHAMVENDAPSGLARAADLMNSLRPDIIIGGGDFVHGGYFSSRKVMDQRWKIAEKFLKRLSVRMEPLIGNHDLDEPFLADGSLAGNDPKLRWRQFFGLRKTYRSFDFRGYRFLMLDSVKVVGGSTPYRGWIDAAQLLWLDKELARIPADQPIILCSHIPFRTSLMESFGVLQGVLGPSPGRVKVTNADLVLEKLSNRPVALIMQGHLHINERVEDRGIPCITGGAVCGDRWHGPNMGTAAGVGIIEIHPGAMPPGWDYRETAQGSVPVRVA